MYLTTSIGSSSSDMESPAELFVKKFCFRWSPHFSAFDFPNKNPPEEVHAIPMAHHPPPIPRNKSRRHMNPVVKN